MHRVGSISIKTVTEEEDIEGVEIWSQYEQDAGVMDTIRRRPRFRELGYVNHEIIPFFLLYSKPLQIFSEEGKTGEYLRCMLIEKATYQNSNGLMIRGEKDDDIYIALYSRIYEEDIVVECKILNFKLLEDLNKLISADRIEDKDRSYFLEDKGKPTEKRTTDTSIFDKVLTEKRQKVGSNRFVFKPASNKLSETQLSSQSLTSTEQINQAINRVILSGLRIRGLNADGSSTQLNLRANIKEIRQMTYKAAIFSLRKYKYSFNQQRNISHPGSGKKIMLNDVQEIVEKLLQVFLDVEEPLTTSLAVTTPRSFEI